MQAAVGQQFEDIIKRVLRISKISSGLFLMQEKETAQISNAYIHYKEHENNRMCISMKNILQHH